MSPRLPTPTSTTTSPTLPTPISLTSSAVCFVRPVVLVPSLCSALLSVPAVGAGTFAGYFTDTSGGNVTVTWPSEFGAPVSDSWGLVPGGPYAGAFNSAAERNFVGEEQIGFVSARCHGDLPPANSALPAHLHFAAILRVENYGNQEVIAGVNNQGFVRTNVNALYWKLSWTLAYASETQGNINFQIDVPDGIGHTVAAGGFANGTNLRGEFSGFTPSNSGNFAFRGTLSQSPAFPASGKVTFMLDIIVSDEPIPECPADLNTDNVVDDADFSVFVQAYDVLECANPSMPSGCPSDLNNDSVVDDSDFSLFVIAYDALVCE